jgi:hypothetical protein
MCENITTGDVPFRKAYLRSQINAVEVDDRAIRIRGSKSTLEQAVTASSQPGTRVFAVLCVNGAPLKIKSRTRISLILRYNYSFRHNSCDVSRALHLHGKSKDIFLAVTPADD